MNTAHLHLMANHLPIAGTVIGTLILLVAMILKKNQIQLTALAILFFSSAGSGVAYLTGEGAESYVEHISGISETLIHTHEELAETFLVVSILTGLASLVAFFALLRKNKYAVVLLWVVLLLGLTSSVMTKFVGSSGGEIRHSEIRSKIRSISLEKDDD